MLFSEVLGIFAPSHPAEISVVPVRNEGAGCVMGGVSLTACLVLFVLRYFELNSA